MKKKRYAHVIGNTLAYFQDTVDSVVTFGFNKLKKAESATAKKDQHKAVKFLGSAAGFLGEVGSQYYKKYDEIKQSKKTSAKKSDS
jgi:hypothetical protein